jgi:hypothetical protein
MNQLRLMSARIRARLDEIERPYIEGMEGLRELLELQDPQGRRKIWRDVLEERTYRRWLALSEIHEQVEWSAS